MGEWKEYKLGDIISITGGFAYKGNLIGEGNNYLLSMGCVSFNDNFLEKGARQYNGDSPERFYAVPGVIVLATRQQSDNLPILGMPAIIPQKYEGHKMIVGANLYKVVIKDDSFDNRYLYWLLKTPNYIRHIRSCQSGTTVRMITKANIEDFTFYAPNKECRTIISDFIWSIDDKIENNKRINENLEQQAQALFKSWFVDFEPFRDQPFVDSELGMIPERWRVGTLGELLEVKYGKDHKKLGDGKYPVYGSGGLMRMADNSLFKGESVLIPRKGSLNNVMYVNESFWTVDTMFYTVPKTENIVLYSFLHLRNKDLSSLNVGSAVPSMTTEILNNMTIIIPSNETLAQFNSKVLAIYSLILHNRAESLRLAQLRDTLLPKLMSGEISL